MSSKNMHRLLLLLRRPIHLACLILPVLALGLILVAPGEQSLGQAGDPVIAPLGLIAEPDTPPVHPLDTADREAWEWEVIRLVNAERTSRGIAPLKRNDALDTATYGHSQDMGVNDFVGHTGSDGSTIVTRALAAGYADRIWIGENIAAGQSSPDTVMYHSDWGWMNSNEHRENILRSDFYEIGMGYYYDAGDTYPGQWWGYEHYWTQDFGSRAGAYPVVINNEAYSTTSRNVQLYVYGPSDATQMQFRNEGGDWSGWESYSTNKEWMLAAGSTITRTVYAQVSNGSQTFEASDYIYHFGVDPVLSISPASATFLTKQGSGTCIPPRQVIQISDGSGGTLDWTSSGSSEWADIVTGTKTITFTCIADVVDDYPISKRTNIITITAEDALNSPQNVPLTLVVAQEIHSIYLPSVTRNYGSP